MDGKSLGVRIRHIREKDIPAVIACNLKWIPEHYHESFYYYCLNLGGDLCFLAENIATNEVIGYNLSVINPANNFFMPNTLKETCSHVVSLVVSPDYRRMGIGRKLMEKPIKVLKSIYPEISKFSLHVRVSNDKAIALYRSLGFDDHEIIKNYYGPDSDDDNTVNELVNETEDGLTMVLDLTESKK